MTNKEASNLQESRISKYLGWNKVVASGARNFHPGDIESEDWLGECKTHTKVSNKVIFHKDIWDKICSEAQSKMKYPILFVDNGSQLLTDTYCMVPSTVFSYLDLSNDQLHFNGNTLSIDISLDTNAGVCYQNKVIATILPLYAFKHELLIQKGFSV